jgi:hypothetical protein
MKSPGTKALLGDRPAAGLSPRGGYTSPDVYPKDQEVRQ